MLVASIRETHSKWRRTRNGCVATRGVPFGMPRNSDRLPIWNGSQIRMAPESFELRVKVSPKFTLLRELRDLGVLFRSHSELKPRIWALGHKHPKPRTAPARKSPQLYFTKTIPCNVAFDAIKFIVVDVHDHKLFVFRVVAIMFASFFFPCSIPTGIL